MCFKLVAQANCYRPANLYAPNPKRESTPLTLNLRRKKWFFVKEKTLTWVAIGRTQHNLLKFLPIPAMSLIK